MARKPAKKSIALRLGVGSSRVSNMIKQGMPCDTIEAAEGWYREHVRPRAKPTRTTPRPATADNGAAGRYRDLLQGFRHVAGNWLRYAAWLNAFYEAMNPDDPVTEAAFDRAAKAAFQADPTDLVQGLAEWDLALIVEHDPHSDMGKAARAALESLTQGS